ncbi:hypothetical protein Bbelb_082160 [Branchiostoma belcheri]|nr:hypothetical protein Bbelb_082160 [Branchiostoma belcheri]
MKKQSERDDRYERRHLGAMVRTVSYNRRESAEDGDATMSAVRARAMRAHNCPNINPQARNEQSTAPATPRRQHTRPREQRITGRRKPVAPPSCNAPTQTASPIPRAKKSGPESKTLTLSSETE